MSQTFPILRRRPSSARRLFAAPVLGLLAAAVMLLAPSLASADSASTLTVVGTSDVQDSGLIPNVIAPAFKAAYPSITFKYVGSATGTAINSAKSGTGGPSALIVHAASLENQFVAGGFSYNNQFGNAIFTNDFVFAGPTADPAGVGTNAGNNIAQAFADVATSGVAGHSTFITRGGTTTASGTTVEEHAIWALLNSAGLTPAGVVLCNVSAADGGGMSPVSPTVQATSGQACPTSGTVDSTTAPPWYFVNSGANQGANVIATSACTVGTSGLGTCYSLTDRGTYDYLAGQNAPGTSTPLIPGLTEVSRNNSASAPGGANALINYFHVYIINPSAPGETVNLSAAQNFVNLLTSPTIQTAVKNYLNTTTDPGGPPFAPTASPAITASGFPSSVEAGKTVTVAGIVTNKQPGYAPIAGKPVAVDELEGLLPVQVASGTTNATGGYSITFTPPSSGVYQVATGNISQIEIASLNPAYGDILSPGAAAASAVAVNGAASITKTTTSTGSVQVSGTVGPAAVDGNARATLLARKQSSKGAFNVIGSQALSAGALKFAVNGSLKGGAWTVEVQYSDPGSLNTATSATKKVKVPAAATNVGIKKLTVKKGALTLTGTVSSAPTTSGATVKLFALSLSKVSIAKTKTKSKKIAKATAAAKAATFRQVAKASVKKGKKTYTIKHKFKRGHRYVLQLQYVKKGQTTTYSKYRYLVVK